MASLDFTFRANPAFKPGGREYFEDYNHQLQEVRAGRQKTRDEAVTEIITPGHQVPLERVMKTTRDGSWSRQSIAGQVVNVAEGMGHDIRAMEFVYRDSKGVEHVGHSIYGAHHGIRWSIRNETECWLNGELLVRNVEGVTPVKQLVERIVNHAPGR